MNIDSRVFVAAVLFALIIAVLFYRAVQITWQNSPFSKEGEAPRLFFSPPEMVYFCYKTCSNFFKSLGSIFYFLA